MRPFKGPRAAATAFSGPAPGPECQCRIPDLDHGLVQAGRRTSRYAGTCGACRGGRNRGDQSRMQRPEPPERLHRPKAARKRRGVAQYLEHESLRVTVENGAPDPSSGDHLSRPQIRWVPAVHLSARPAFHSGAGARPSRRQCAPGGKHRDVCSSKNRKSVLSDLSQTPDGAPGLMAMGTRRIVRPR